MASYGLYDGKDMLMKHTFFRALGISLDNVNEIMDNSFSAFLFTTTNFNISCIILLQYTWIPSDMML